MFSRGKRFLANMAKRDSNCLVFAIIFFASLLFIFRTIPSGVELPNNVDAGWFLPESPRFLLYISGSALAGLSLIGFLRSIGSHKTSVEYPPISALIDFRELAALLILLLTMPLIKWLGLTAAGALVGMGLVALAGVKKSHVYLIVGVIVPVVVWGFFTYVLSVPIPFV